MSSYEGVLIDGFIGRIYIVGTVVRIDFKTADLAAAQSLFNKFVIKNLQSMPPPE